MELRLSARSLIVLLLLSIGAIVAIDAVADEPFYRGDYYVIDKEWRNGAFTHWAWGNEQVAKVDEEGNPVLDSDGNQVYETQWYDEVHPAMGGWDSAREPLDFSGYAITIDGVDYPVFKGRLNGRIRDLNENKIQNPDYLTDKDFRPLTGFQLNYQITGSANESFQVPFADGNIYKFYGDDRGVYKSNYDPATDPDTHYVTDEELATHNGKRFKIYFNGDGISKNEIAESRSNDFDPVYQWERPDCHATRIHLWGEGGDLTPWALGHHCTRIASKLVQADYDEDGVIDEEYYQPLFTFTGKSWTIKAYEFEFVYFGGNPTGIIFRQESLKGDHLVPGKYYDYTGPHDTFLCPICGDHAHEIPIYDEYHNYIERTEYSIHPYYRCDFDKFYNGALYQFSMNGSTMPIENPKFSVEQQEDPYDNQYYPTPEDPDGYNEHTIWFIDTDNWLQIKEDNTPDYYTLITEWEVEDYGYGPKWYYSTAETTHFPSFTGLHAEIVNTRYKTSFFEDGNGVKLEYGVGEYSGLTSYGYMVLSSKFVDPDNPWGVPAKNLRIDYDYDRETGTNGLRYVKLNGKWFPMVKLNFRLPSQVTEFELNRYGTPRSSDYLPLVDGGVYYYAGTGVKTPILTYEQAIKDGLEIAHTMDEIPQEQTPRPGKIYVNLGANKIMEPALWRVPYCVPFKRDALSNPSAKVVDRTQYYPEWDKYIDDPNVWSNDPYFSNYSSHDFSRYDHDNLRIPLPRWVKYDPESPEYVNSELAKYEMKPVEGRDGVYYFDVEDLNQYNDFVCYYYYYGEQFQFKQVTKDEFADYVYNYLKQNSYWYDYKEYTQEIRKDNNKPEGLVYAIDKYIDPGNGWFKVKLAKTMVPAVDEDGDEILDDDLNPVMVEGLDRVEVNATEYDQKWKDNAESLREGYVYIREVHHHYGTSETAIHSFGDCCRWADDDYQAYDDQNGKDKVRYFKAKVEDYETVDYLSAEYRMDAAAAVEYIDKYYLHENEPEWMDWRVVCGYVPGYHEYYVADEDKPMLETDYPVYYSQQVVNGQDVGTSYIDKEMQGARAHVAHPASRSKFFDPTNWDKYVYDIGVDCVHPSYMTPAEFEALEPISENTPHIYLAGNKVLQGNNDYNLRNCVVLDNDHGAFFYDFKNLAPDSPAEFKISTVNVAEYAAKAEKENFPGYYEGQRGWATFNLGLVGPHKDPNDEGYEKWHEEYVLPGAPTRKIRLSTDQTYGYNTYTQYSWYIDVATDEKGDIWKGMKPGDYYFVIDFLPEDKSVTLLDFDPHARPDFQGVEVRTEELDGEQSSTLHADATHQVLPGSEHNCDARHDYINILSADLGVEPTEAAIVEKNKYKVIYTIYINDKKAYYIYNTEQGGVPKAIHADYLDLSEDAKFAMRGRYYDEKTGGYFVSKYKSEAMTHVLTGAQAPDVDVNYSGLRFYLTDPDEVIQNHIAHNVAVGAALSLSYCLPQTMDNNSYVSLPGYEILEAELDGELIENEDVKAPLVHKDHFIVNSPTNPWGYWLGMNTNNPWNPGDQSNVSSWAGHVKADEHLPVLVDQMKVYDEYNVLNTPKHEGRVKLNVYASYPFLVRRNQLDLSEVPDIFTETPDPATLDETTAHLLDESTPVSTGIPDNLEDYKMALITRANTKQIVLDQGVTTDVAGVSIDDNDGEAVYYNLQGILMPTDRLTPGVYLRKVGDTVEKIVIK